MGEMTRKELAAMTDQELLAYERERHGDPYMTLADAKAMRHTDLKFWHLGRAQGRGRARAARETVPRTNCDG
jgi:hypothetical protein